jgi:hypothetical protein
MEDNDKVMFYDKYVHGWQVINDLLKGFRLYMKRIFWTIK